LFLSPLPRSLRSYLHTVVVFVALCLFAFEIYATPSTGLGSPGAVWEHLTAIATQGGAYKGPVADNKGGSYITMFSKVGVEQTDTLAHEWRTGQACLVVHHRRFGCCPPLAVQGGFIFGVINIIVSAGALVRAPA
jgi:hypothetical protein